MRTLSEVGWFTRHEAARYWLGVLYRKPRVLEKASMGLSPVQTLSVTVKLYLHSLPYLVLLTLALRILLFDVIAGPSSGDLFGPHLPWLASGLVCGFVVALVGALARLFASQLGFGLRVGLRFGLGVGLGVGLGFGISGGLAAILLDLFKSNIAGYVVLFSLATFGIGLVNGFRRGQQANFVVRLARGLARGLAGGLVVGPAISAAILLGIWVIGGLLSAPTTWWLVGGPSSVLVVGLICGFVGELVVGLAGGVAIGIAGALWLWLESGIAKGFQTGLGHTLGFALAYFAVLLRIHYWPLFWWLSWPVVYGRLYSWHPVAWDDCCRIPFPGLDRLLYAYAKHNRPAADIEIERLIGEYPTQRSAALLVRTVLVARDAGRVSRVADLEPLVARLPEGKRGYLGQTARLREIVLELVAADKRAATVEAHLRTADAAELCLQIRDFRDQVAGFAEPLASEFRQASLHWQKLSESMMTVARTEAEHAPQVFRAGDKVVDRDREAFVLRRAVCRI